MHKCYRSDGCRDAKISLFAIVSIHEKVVVRVIIFTSIIVVHVLLWRVIVNEEIVMKLAPRHGHGRLTSPHGGQVGLAIPRIERSMVAGLPASREDEIVAEIIGLQIHH